MLAALVLADCEASCALDEDDAEEDGAGAGAGAGDGAGVGVGVTLALCDALVCEAMLCCSVCENGSAFAVSVAALADELLVTVSKSALISESGDMVDPVYPLSLVISGHGRLFE